MARNNVRKINAPQQRAVNAFSVFKEDKNWKYQEQLCLDCPVSNRNVCVTGAYNETLVEKACANYETVPCEQFDIELQVMDLEATNGRDWGEIDHKLFNDLLLEDIKEHFSDQLHQSKSKAVGLKVFTLSLHLIFPGDTQDSPNLSLLLEEYTFNEFLTFVLVILRDRAQVEPEMSNNVVAASTSQNVGDGGLIPCSLSQTDASALQEYPQEIREEILNNIPAHRNPETRTDASPWGLNLNHLIFSAPLGMR
ncbi:hypothetical protein Tco_0629126 [Tanacetum coccineum]|uniref:Uncharacterized protein n=1 Tax=Tanacetum coccineum TaxID=301880 RepID=A0ABQ4WS82_9ASTR